LVAEEISVMSRRIGTKMIRQTPKEEEEEEMRGLSAK
jgi:hypothetical protein